MTVVQNGTKNPPFLCEDVMRCEFCLRRSDFGCEHDTLSEDERTERRREQEARRAAGEHRPLRCPCHPDCTRTY